VQLGFQESSTSWLIFIRRSTGVYAFEKGAVADLYSTTVATLDAWDHVVWTVGTDNIPILYVNGEQVYNSADSQAFVATTRNNTIGGDIAGIPSWEGRLDDVYIFDRALSLDEIKALASTRNYFNCPDTVAGSAGLIMRQLYGGGQL